MQDLTPTPTLAMQGAGGGPGPQESRGALGSPSGDLRQVFCCVRSPPQPCTLGLCSSRVSSLQVTETTVTRARPLCAPRPGEGLPSGCEDLCGQQLCVARPG